MFLVGPTAVGKSALAVLIAERCGGEIVNADAFQLYKGLDLLAAKPDRNLRWRAPHHLFGVVPLCETLSAGRYLELARPCLEDLARRGRVAIVVGGTGLYVKALTHGLAPLLPSARPELRAEWDALSLPQLAARLWELDPFGARTVDLQNRRRLVRALEICVTTGRPFSDQRQEWGPDTGETTKGFFLDCPRPRLHARITDRVDAMFREGVIEEVRSHPAEGLGPTAARMIGYSEIRAFLSGELPMAECRRRIEAATRQYAKRQCTWFKRETVFRRVELATGAPEELEQVARLLTGWIAEQAAAGASGSR